MLLSAAEQQEFLEEYNVTADMFRNSRFTWKELDCIASDHLNKSEEHNATLQQYENIIRRCRYVHSLRYRVKDVYHLLEKIIRKNPQHLKTGQSISLSNYTEKVTDLMGIRVLLLFKDDWLSVHNFLMNKFCTKLAGDPFIYIRPGDDKSLYEGRIKIVEERPYRSAHYLVRAESGSTIEVQVRTLYEEAWGEIDHKVRYPYNMSNEMIEKYVVLMNRLTGMADEMGTFIHNYIQNFELAKSKGVMNDNEVFQYILDKLEECGDPKIKKEITDKILEASNYRQMKNVSDLFVDVIRKL